MTEQNQPPPNPFSSDADDEDLKLISFLQANRPQVPDPHPQAEDRLMQRIAQEEMQSPSSPVAQKRRWNPAIFIGIGAILLGGVVWQLRQWNAPLYANADIELETFLLGTWGSLSSPEEPFSEWDWFPEEESVASESFGTHPSSPQSSTSYPSAQESTP